MISILIPVYNYNVVSLVTELSSQLQSLKIEGEIIVYDDLSEANYKEQNKTLTGVSGVIYKELQENLGRIQMRMLLANAAKYTWVLFIDCDSIVNDAKYLSKYIQAIETGDQVYTGGRKYAPDPPIDCKKRLHWKYGSRREVIKGNTTAFHTNNFCLRKEIFQQLKFPSYVNGYGHEDTWMKLELQKLNIKIKHFNNPVVHNGIIDVDEFLAKTWQALSNLLLLAQNTDKKSLRKNVGLYNAFYKLQKAGLKKMFSLFYKKMEEKILVNLNSCYPSLRYYDLYRINALIKISKQNVVEKRNDKS